MCVPLKHLYGGEDDNTRWEPLLTSNSHTGHEQAIAMSRVKAEVMELCKYLEEDIPELFA